MIYKKMKFTLPEYKEKKEIYELLGYKEESYAEKDFYCYVTFSIDENNKNYFKLKQIEKEIYKKGPPFFPIILFVVAAFVLLSFFVIMLAISIKDNTPFNLNAYSIGFLLPAFGFIAACVLYTYFYFSINRKLIQKGIPTKEQIKEMVDAINK